MEQKIEKDNHLYTANLIHSSVWEGELSYKCSRYCYRLRIVKMAHLYVVLVEHNNYFSRRILMLLLFKRKLQSRKQDCGSYPHAMSWGMPIFQFNRTSGFALTLYQKISSSGQSHCKSRKINRQIPCYRIKMLPLKDSK